MLFQLQWRNSQYFNISHVFLNSLNSLKTEIYFRAKTTNFSLTKFCLLRNASIRKSELLAHRFEVTQEKSQAPYSIDSFGVIKNNSAKQPLFLTSQYKLWLRGSKYKKRFDKLKSLLISHSSTYQLPVRKSTPKSSLLTFRYGSLSLLFNSIEQEKCVAVVTYNIFLENSAFIGNYSKTTQAFSFNFTSENLIKSHCNSSFISENASVKRTQQQTMKKKSMTNCDYYSSLSRRKRELLRYKGLLAHGISPNAKRQNLSPLNYASWRRKFNKFIGHSEVILGMGNQDLNMCKQSVNCKLPTCWCFGRKPSFDSRNIPQFVYFTFDGIVDKITRKKIAQLFSQDRTNENGCHIRATIFITGLVSDYKEINWLYKAGHEIALYGLSNDLVDPFMKHLEIPVQKKLLERYAGISDLYVTGWRNVHDTSKWHKQLDSFKKYNMVYDSSIVIRPSSVTEQGIWPFTLEFGWDENCKNSSCRFKTKESEVLWEIPSILYSNFKTSKLCYYIDDCFNDSHTSLETYDNLVRNFFIAHKSKMPFGVRLRKYWFDKQNKANFGGLDAFIKFLLDLDNVYLISISDLVGWMRHPQPIFTERNIKSFLGIGC
uniref:NodB homology domain-containing protein n=2 Tax=Octopus bimaculoides TaxID=37653 RepID=A0A0L8FSR5_OCTBM